MQVMESIIMSETRFTLEITNPIFTVSEKWLVDELREVGMKFANYHNGFMFRDAENGSYIATRTNCIIELRFGEGEAHMNGWHAL